MIKSVSNRIISVVLAMVVFVNLFSFPASAATKLSIGWKTLTIGLGEEYQFIATTNSTKAVNWSTSNNSIVTINKKGVSKGIKTGKATLTATVDGVSRSVAVTVKKAPDKVTVKDIYLGVGENNKVIVNLPSGTSSKGITYKSSNTKIADVSATGEVRGISAGICTITVTTFNGISAKMNVAVFRTGNSADSEKDKKMYAKAFEIVNTHTKSTDTPFEKEIAIHDYLVKTVKYDYSFARDSYSAYGALINGKSVCSGYAQAFQLLMDILEIECKTVSGTANNGSGNGYQGHAWNMVKLDDEWYNIDVTWDDLSNPDIIRWSYFNITDSMMGTNHKWDNGNYPSATATKYNYVKHFGLEINSRDGLKKYISEKIENNEKSFESYCDFDISNSELWDIIQSCISKQGYRLEGGTAGNRSINTEYYNWITIDIEYSKNDINDYIFYNDYIYDYENEY